MVRITRPAPEPDKARQPPGASNGCPRQAWDEVQTDTHGKRSYPPHELYMAVGLHKTGITSAYRGSKTYDKRQMRPDGKTRPKRHNQRDPDKSLEKVACFRITTSLAIDICGCPFTGC